VILSALVVKWRLDIQNNGDCCTYEDHVPFEGRHSNCSIRINSSGESAIIKVTHLRYPLASGLLASSDNASTTVTAEHGMRCVCTHMCMRASMVAGYCFIVEDASRSHQIVV
jgi:hypothetical protein